VVTERCCVTTDRAHAADDQVVLIDDHVLFAGDLVLTGQFPIVPYFPPFDADVDANHWIAGRTHGSPVGNRRARPRRTFG
jgi:hypothetical protein